ncbi:NAD(P)-dependent dehydrogenase, short-chain alcohol dehydrogenase family [Geodermatophilus saharensis]|uniref:NAD(P)-dependent dehydrogenase, short-chain alcohol dehydrogenase family n=1 Tax=Geodermatophilus saharensis TaxID=1137994 RepID=A0A239CVD2_9ACTN|nr:SDR family oxidoreductase [Geodermatophilus saharensis]SNS23621.1 NAD(P)-dependent dehydrogenase, short-chain alcohol dehydrogenase family [Geodermatophilus saharensis]
MDLHLTNRVALVTGGASGIGRACVDALLAEGARVAVLDRSADGETVVDGLRQRGLPVEFVQADVTVEAEVADAVARTVDSFGRLDTVLGCAGVSGPVGTLAADVSERDWDRVMAVNVKGNFLVAKHSIPRLAGSDVGTMVFIASDSALVGFEGMTPYCTSKGAVLQLTRALSVDHPGIRVNCLCPGVVDTPMSRADLGRPQGFAGVGLPVMQPEQIAAHAAFLASPVSAPINGSPIVSDFGYVARSALPPLDFDTP